MSFSLDECYKLYQSKIALGNGPGKGETQQPGSLIDMSRVVQMQRINYFQSRTNNVNGFIFAKARSNACSPPLTRNDTEVNIATSTIPDSKPLIVSSPIE